LNHLTIAQYVEHCKRRNLRPNYIASQRNSLLRLAGWASRNLFSLTTHELETYLDSANLQPGSRAAEIACYRSFYAWAFDHGMTADNPALKLVRPRQPERLPRPMPAQDVKRALAEAPCQVAPILNLAVYAGLRACEIAQLKAEDITSDLIRVRESKGGSETAVPVSPLLASVLSRCPLPQYGWLFPGRNGGHLSRSRICQLANRYLASIGVKHTLHSLRHAYGTAIYRATKDLRLTQELMRHRSMQSTVLYTLIDNDSARQAVSALRW
jgi:site-specific recombinase XerD